MLKADQPTIFDKTKLLTAVSSAEDDNLSLARGPADLVLPARKRWLDKLGLSLDQLVVMDVTHPGAWDAIIEVSAADRAKGATEQQTTIQADALVTNEADVALFLLTADCQPVIIHDPVHHAVALVHLGWQSVDAELPRKIVEFMAERYGSQPAELKVYIGPAIKADSYIQPIAYQAGDSRWHPYIQELQDGFRIDISGFTKAQLLAAGIAGHNLEISPVDTATNGDYFSHYRSVRSDGAEPEARFATLCMLK